MAEQATQTIPKGYNQTEVGLIPSGWDVKELGTIAHFENGKAHENYISDDGDYIVINSRFISSEGEVIKYSNKNLSPINSGDIALVMSDIPNGKALAKCYLVKQDNKFALNQRICCLRANEIDNTFLYYSVNRNNYFLQFDNGVSQTNLRKGDLLKCLLPVPTNKDEQSAISIALSNADELINSLEKFITKKRAIKQGAMQKLFTGKRRLPGFSGEWEVKKLRDLLDYERPDRYIVKTTQYIENGETPVLTANKSFMLGYTNEEFGVYRSLPAVIFDDFITDSKYVDFPFKVKSSAIKILKTKKADTILKFVYERMKLIDFPLGGHKRYYISEYQNLEVLMPKPEEQRAIAGVISDMDKEIRSLEQKLAKYRMLKQGMMHVLLTGKIRLI